MFNLIAHDCDFPLCIKKVLFKKILRRKFFIFFGRLIEPLIDYRYLISTIPNLLLSVIQMFIFNNSIYNSFFFFL